VFRDSTDYRRYLELLERYQRRHRFTLYAYVLMPNHLHLLISPGRIPLSKTMQGIQQTYTRHFNRRHRLIGHCFQGRYKAILCQSDAYLLELVRYLHLNPVRANIVQTPEEYAWCSHRLYLEGKDPGVVAIDGVLGQFSLTKLRAINAYRAFVMAGLPQGHRDDLYAVAGQRFLGDERFVEGMERRTRRETARPPVEVSIGAIAGRVARELGLQEANIRGKGRNRAAARSRAIVAYVAREETGHSLKSVARYVGRDEATLTVAVRRLEDQMADDPQLSARVAHLRRVIRRGAQRRINKQIIKA
jgi:REP element-mobilizing transposase RayT